MITFLELFVLLMMGYHQCLDCEKGISFIGFLVILDLSFLFRCCLASRKYLPSTSQVPASQLVSGGDKNRQRRTDVIG